MLKKFDSLDSTQDEAKRSGVPGDVIFALEQTKGRGKPGSGWFSPIGGLYFSIVKKAEKDVSDLLFVTELTANVVLKALSAYGITGEIKKPNDVLVRGKKICGILTEKSGERLIIGIGVNLNITEFPEGLNATSAELLLGKKTDPGEFLESFISLFDKEYSKFIESIV